MALHCGFVKKATAASGCIFISIDNIVRAHDSVFSPYVCESNPLEDPGEPTTGRLDRELSVTDIVRLGRDFSSSVL